MTTIYNREHRCPKCGGGASVSWDSALRQLARRCAVCGYGWHELPLDSDEATDAIHKRLSRMALGERT